MDKPVVLDEIVYSDLCKFRDLLKLPSLSEAVRVLLVAKVDFPELVAIMFGS